MKTIEQKVAESLTQAPLEVRIGRRTFFVPRPSSGTIVMISKEISRLPISKIDYSSEDSLIASGLGPTRGFTGIGRIIATAVIGAKRLSSVLAPFWRIRFRRIARLAMVEMAPPQQFDLLKKIFGRMELADFFAITTFLTEINLTKPREVETTQSGQ